MTMTERTGVRDLTYSRAHRPRQVQMFIGPRRAAQMTVIDVDWCEYCYRCAMPILLVETERSSGPPKDARVTTNLGRAAGVPVLSVSYEVEDEEPSSYRVRRLYPLERGVSVYTPEEYWWLIWSFHGEHECSA